MTSPAAPCLIDLPIELLATIAAYLSPVDRINFSETCRLFEDVCCTKSIAKNVDLSRCYKLSESQLKRFTTFPKRCLNIGVLNLNCCYWLSSKVLVQCISRLKNLEELHLLECPIQTQLPKLLARLHHLVSLSFTATDMNVFSSQLSSWTALANSNLSGLKSLSIVYNRYIGLELSLKYAVVCKKLESLNLLFCTKDPSLNPVIKDKRPTLILPQSLKEISVERCLGDPWIAYDLGLLEIYCPIETLWENLWFTSGSYFLVKRIVQRQLSATQFANLKAVNLNSLFSRSDHSLLNRDTPVHNMILDMFRLGHPMQCTKLSLKDAFISPQLLSAVAMNCPQLRILQLEFTMMIGKQEDKQKSFELLCERCSHITDIRVQGADICQDIWTPLSKLRDVRKLSISLYGLPIVKASENNACDSPLMTQSFSKQRVGIQTLATDDEMKKSQIWILTENCKHVEDVEISGKGNGPFADVDLFCISRWIKLRSLSVLLMPFVHGQFLTTILHDCQSLETLKLKEVSARADCIYLRPLADGLRFAHKLKDLRIFHRNINLSAQFLESTSHCKTLERISIDTVSNLNDRVIISIVNMVQKLPNLVFVHIVVEGTKKDYKNLKQHILKFKEQRPAFFCAIHEVTDEISMEKWPTHHLQLKL